LEQKETAMSSPQLTPTIGGENTESTSSEANIRELVARVLKRCSKIKSREQVVFDLNTLTKSGVTKNMLDDWASLSKKGLRFPASLVGPFCEVTGDDSLRHFVMGEHLNRRCEVGRQVLNSRDLWEALAPALARRWAQYLRQVKGTRKAKRTRKA
jgi:hypothetical protein